MLARVAVMLFMLFAFAYGVLWCAIRLRYFTGPRVKTMLATAGIGVLALFAALIVFAILSASDHSF